MKSRAHKKNIAISSGERKRKQNNKKTKDAHDTEEGNNMKYEEKD